MVLIFQVDAIDLLWLLRPHGSREPWSRVIYSTLGSSACVFSDCSSVRRSVPCLQRHTLNQDTFVYKMSLRWPWQFAEYVTLYVQSNSNSYLRACTIICACLHPRTSWWGDRRNSWLFCALNFSCLSSPKHNCDQKIFGWVRALPL